MAKQIIHDQRDRYEELVTEYEVRQVRPNRGDRTIELWISQYKVRDEGTQGRKVGRSQNMLVYLSPEEWKQLTQQVQNG